MFLVLKALARIASGGFYRKIRVSGEAWTGGACLWAPNHPNAIVDVMVVFATTPVALRPVSKHTLFSHPVLKPLLWMTRSIPVYRKQDVAPGETASNSDALRAVSAALSEGGNVLIFPEGVGHDEPALAPLKSGIGRMAVLAFEGQPALQRVTVQPLILDYTEKDMFRSDVAVDFCAPVTVSRGMTHQEIVSQVSASMARTLAAFSSWDQRRNWQFLYSIARGHSASSNAKDFRAFVERLRPVFEADALLMGRIQTLRRVLFAANLHTEQLAWAERHERKRSWFALILLEGWLHFLMLLPFQIAAVVLWYLPYRFCGWLASKTTKYRDEISTYKIAHALWIFPIWGLVATFAATLYVRNAHPAWAFGPVYGVLFGMGAVLIVLGILSSESNGRFKGNWDLARMRLFYPREWYALLDEWRDIAGAVRSKAR